ncbi:TPA: DUF2857 domain-containing protein [Yersinia enterocolitica]|jgi:hypothetical protein|uniref:DUF2857 domain-containing protein n=1 Tax=Obesumbacterium proteus ATCC 12841 TaxID=1354268 RepID=A0AA91IS76_9GAMM|nr:MULTISPECIES: DUF2857 domain-containing protein [Enterobacterales]EKN3386494.1 DUF2857 domain-containing protein [Yersinia enterocolitica]MCQ7058752.1 DUF2857 domain-containing protein [Escherichia coli]AMO81446.1 hypothetical protein DSM2777_10635 [Obesumbacterium proteus]EKN3402929.1 DUF2857 domain-containing protein [Yersinia enterocolitica]EKN3529667.1 DUF2857 domain-containing protein [Yersinia enterocolitica]
MIPLINYTILTDALHALKEGNIRHCESLGFTFDEMNALNQLSLDELFTVSRAAAPFVSVSVRHDVLHHLLAQARQEYHHQQEINRAIRLGGSISLLNYYFGLTSNEVCLRRRLLGVSVPYGRTPEPDEETDAAIWLQWQKCRVENLESPNALIAMMQVTEVLLPRFQGLSLTMVWRRITLCQKGVAADRRTSHAG